MNSSPSAVVNVSSEQGFELRPLDQTDYSPPEPETERQSAISHIEKKIKRLTTTVKLIFVVGVALTLIFSLIHNMLSSDEKDIKPEKIQKLANLLLLSENFDIEQIKDICKFNPKLCHRSTTPNPISQSN